MIAKSMHYQAIGIIAARSPPFANSVPEHGVLVDLPQRVGDLHGLAVPRMRMRQGVTCLLPRFLLLLLSRHDPGVSHAAAKSCFQSDALPPKCHSSDLTGSIKFRASPEYFQ